MVNAFDEFLSSIDCVGVSFSNIEDAAFMELSHCDRLDSISSYIQLRKRNEELVNRLYSEERELMAEIDVYKRQGRQVGPIEWPDILNGQALHIGYLTCELTATGYCQLDIEPTLLQGFRRLDCLKDTLLFDQPSRECYKKSFACAAKLLSPIPWRGGFSKFIGVDRVVNNILCVESDAA